LSEALVNVLWFGIGVLCREVRGRWRGGLGQNAARKLPGGKDHQMGAVWCDERGMV